MNKFESWVLKGILRKIVLQGGHTERITEFYKLLVQAARAEFYEDNKAILDAFLKGCHADALKATPKKEDAK